MKTSPLHHHDHQTRLPGCFVAGCAAVLLVLLFGVVLVVAATDDDSRGHSTGHCSPAVAGTVDPVTCMPYGSSGNPHPGTNDSRSSASRTGQKPGGGAPAAKVPAAPKAPAAPPRISLRK